MGKSKTPKLPKQQTQINQPSFSAFPVALFYCSLIIFLPIITFFFTKYYMFDNFLQLSAVQSNIYSAVAAVIALHVALGMYLYRAYTDSESVNPQTTKED